MKGRLYKIIKLFCLYSIVLMASCNSDKVQKEHDFIPFDDSYLQLTSSALYADSTITIELFFDNTSINDTFWIPISHWEMDAVFENPGYLMKGMPHNAYIVNYFLISPQSPSFKTMIDKSIGPVYKYFPKILQLEPNSKKRIQVKFNIALDLKDTIEFVLNSYIPVSNSLNFNNLFLSIPFKIDSSVYMITDEINMEFESMSGKDQPWLEYASSNIKLDSTYDMMIINKFQQQLRSTCKIEIKERLILKKN